MAWMRACIRPNAKPSDRDAPGLLLECIEQRPPCAPGEQEGGPLLPYPFGANLRHRQAPRHGDAHRLLFVLAHARLVGPEDTQSGDHTAMLDAPDRGVLPTGNRRRAGRVCHTEGGEDCNGSSAFDVMSPPFEILAEPVI